MMKKLAVTVFVASLAAIGCGSDDGTPVKRDGGTDVKVLDTQAPDVQGLPDVLVPGPDAPIANEVQPDKPGVDATVDGGPKPTDTQVDVQMGEVNQKPDVAQPDRPIDAPKPVDLPPGEAAQPVDGGVDGSVG